MKKKVKLTLREIENGWGSLEAYLEEQRRTGLCELETKAFDVAANKSFTIDFLDKTRVPQLSSAQPPVLVDLATPIQVELGVHQINHLTFIRWLYISGRLES